MVLTIIQEIFLLVARMKILGCFQALAIDVLAPNGIKKKKIGYILEFLGWGN